MKGRYHINSRNMIEENMADETNRADKTEKKVFSYMERHHMIVPGDKVVVGVSGGADSVCLLFLLWEYCRRVPVSLAAAHVNHGLRADAGKDAEYVEELCRRLEVPFYLTEADVRELAARERCSEEDAGRRARYRAFGRAAEKMGGAKIAVAHNMGDNAETMLFHLFRGSGLKGLCGIAPVRDEVIHPLLCLERREVEAYLRKRGISWRTDSTNGEDHYRRNRIRHHILPYAEAEIAQGATVHMCRTAELLSETEDYLERQTEAAWEQCVKIAGQGGQRAVGRSEGQKGDAERTAGITEQKPCYTVDVSRFRELHAVLRKRILFGIAKALSPTGKDISAVHVEDVLSLFEERGNRDVDLPFGICAKRRYGEVLLEREGGGNAAAPAELRRQELPERAQKLRTWEDASGREVELREQDFPATVTLETGEILELGIFSAVKGQEVPRNQYTKWLDYDKIIGFPVVRFRRQGDYLTIADGKGGLRHKSLKDYMVTEKIPREHRGRIPVLAAGSHVLWLAGYRISEYFKVGENTNRILQVQLKKGFTASETEEENVGMH